MGIETAFILLFVVATAVAVLTRRLRIPYSVALVLAGLILGGLHLFPAPALTKELLFGVFLPGLVFEAAFHIDTRDLRANLITVLSLAVPGVVACIALVTVSLPFIVGISGLVPRFDWKVGLVFGAVISATDPVAVVALFRNLHAPRRLTLLLDAESLLNDGTAIVFFTLSLSLVSGIATGIGQLLLQFLSIVGAGALIGTAVGVATALLLRQIDEPMIEITLTTIAAYGSFVTAEALHASGVIATVAAGIFCGNLGARGGAMSATTRVAAATFWEYAVFALNSVVFLLVGFEVRMGDLLTHWVSIVIAYVVVTLGRAVMIVAAQRMLSFTRERFAARWSLVLTWGGLRGALPMVLVLSLPPAFPDRELLVSMTFGVAVLSILIQGLTMPALLGLLGIVTDRTHQVDYEYRSGAVRAAAAALRELDRMAAERSLNPETLETLRCEYRRRGDAAEQQLRALMLDSRELLTGDLLKGRRRLLDIERDQVMHSYRQGALGRESQERLLADIDARALEETGDVQTAQRPDSERLGPEGRPPNAGG
ncbi:MAG TPA: cation:proton antiporter [Steroidobacteraceae bacterium]|nr:cation:proton antiporter [Steroidobacteraceae bacterium]